MPPHDEDPRINRRRSSSSTNLSSKPSPRDGSIEELPTSFHRYSSIIVKTQDLPTSLKRLSDLKTRSASTRRFSTQELPTSLLRYSAVSATPKELPTSLRHFSDLKSNGVLSQVILVGERSPELSSNIEHMEDLPTSFQRYSILTAEPQDLPSSLQPFLELKSRSVYSRASSINSSSPEPIPQELPESLQRLSDLKSRTASTRACSASRILSKACSQNTFTMELPTSFHRYSLLTAVPQGLPTSLQRLSDLQSKRASLGDRSIGGLPTSFHRYSVLTAKTQDLPTSLHRYSELKSIDVPCQGVIYHTLTPDPSPQADPIGEQSQQTPPEIISVSGSGFAGVLDEAETLDPSISDSQSDSGWVVS